MSHKLEEMMKEGSFEQICALKKDFIKLLDNELHTKGVDDINAKDCGEVADMIKDLAEAEKSCMEACYYKKIIHAMEEAEEDDDRMGYNSRRYSNGRYAPKGRGSRMGYIPPFMMKPYYMEEYGRWNDDEWDPSEMMGYSNGRSNNSQSENSSRSSNNENRSQSGTRMGYERDNDWDPDRDPTHSMTYNEYRKAKRHYMESRNPSDKQSMDDYGQRHVHEALDTLKDIWKDADPTMRKKMKTEMQTVLNEMPT